jgi:hypothetical protein
MSTTAVAAFRFSTVSNSYAQRKGKGRNVGVIGVAIFEEEGEPQMILPESPPPRPSGGYWRDGDSASAGGSSGRGRAPAPEADQAAPRSAPQPARAPAKSGTATRGAGGAAPSRRMESSSADSRASGEVCCRPTERQRPGLGTEWGEQRYSAIDFTQFVRAHPTVPSAMAELRYNDSSGLRALGIALAPSPSEDEIWTRETADPFPGSRFATPP